MIWVASVGIISQYMKRKGVSAAWAAATAAAMSLATAGWSISAPRVYVTDLQRTQGHRHMNVEL